MKRIHKELTSLLKTQNSRKLLENDFIISPESTLECIKVIVKCPQDSLYRHKFVRLNFNIPENYPYEPPSVQFLNHDQSRIHPNMYEDGKCCATILNTWGDRIDEKWTSCMSIESVIVGFMSLFDNDPYVHEPGNRGDDSYNIYVLYQTWYTCCIEYLVNETDTLFTNFINEYIKENIDDISRYIDYCIYLYPYGEYFTNCYDIDAYELDYQYVKYVILGASKKLTQEIESPITKSYIPNVSRDNCLVCYDTRGIDDFYKTLSCGHKFHILCIEDHMKYNQMLCPLCRAMISINDYKDITSKYISSCNGKRYNKYGRTFLSMCNETTEFAVL